MGKTLCHLSGEPRIVMNPQEKEDLIRILSNFETRNSKDIQFLMRIAFEHGKNSKKNKTFEEFQFAIKQLLDL